MATIAIGISKGPPGASASIPLDALEQDGVPPEQGDQVSFSVDGTVQSVSGTTAKVKIDAINGEPVNESAAEESAEDQAEGDTGDTGAGGGGGPGGLSGMSAADLGARLKKRAKKGGPPPLM